jgi:hypothetical protein
MTDYLDSTYAKDLVTRRPVKGANDLLKKIPVIWVPKHQKTVEASTFGSELLESRIDVEFILDVRFMLRT